MTATGSRRRTVRIVCQVGLVIGMLLVLAGAAWQTLAKPEHVWSPKQAEEFREARTAWHNLQYGDPQQPSALESAGRAAQREAAQRRFEQVHDELEDAIATHRHRGTRLMHSGLAAMVLFGVGYLSSRDQ